MTRTTKQVLDQEYRYYFYCETEGCWSVVRYIEDSTGNGYCPGCAMIRASEAADAPRENPVEDGQPSEG